MMLNNKRRLHYACIKLMHAHKCIISTSYELIILLLEKQWRRNKCLKKNESCAGCPRTDNSVSAKTSRISYQVPNPDTSQAHHWSEPNPRDILSVPPNCQTQPIVLDVFAVKYISICSNTKLGHATGTESIHCKNYDFNTCQYFSRLPFVLHIRRVQSCPWGLPAWPALQTPQPITGVAEHTLPALTMHLRWRWISKPKVREAQNYGSNNNEGNVVEMH